MSDALPPGEANQDHLTMIDSAAAAKSIAHLAAAVVLTPEPLAIESNLPIQIIVEDVHAAFSKTVAFFRPPMDDQSLPAGIDSSARIDPSAHVHSSAVIGPDAVIGPRVTIHPGVTIAGRCRIGDECVLHPGVTLYSYTRLHARVRVHSGSVIGAHGFGYRLIDGRHRPSAQLGFVEIESDVDVGACVTIDRGTYGATRIGEGTKIDNQVMIAHNCQIGKHNLLCSQVGIAGSCRTGDYVVLAGQVGLKDHVTLGDQTIVAAQSGVMDDLDGHAVYMGSPTMTQREQMQVIAVQRRLPELRRSVRQIEKKLESLSQTSPNSVPEPSAMNRPRPAA